MSADPDPGAAPVQVQAGEGSMPHVDARQAVGVQVGQDNTQIVYVYGKGTWSDGVAAPPLVSVSGKIDSPYRGLRAFEEQDAPFFFGRDTATADVLKHMSLCVDGTGLLVVSGVSGAGKSSLLRAGVLPQIRGAGLAAAPEAAWWPRLLFTPGPTPLDVLAVQVAHVAGVDAGAVRRGLDDDASRFALTARQAALAQLGGPPEEPGSPPRKQRLLLVVDQFEQLFTQCPDEKQRQAFITALCAAAAKDGQEQDAAALIVLGVRADFEARCADYPQLAGAIQDRYLVTSMTERQLRMAITGPAKRAGSSVDGELVDVLLEEVSTRQPGSSAAILGRSSVSGAGILPLLSHALDQAWRIRAGDVLTLADYERTGGIEGAVADSAQHAYDSLTPAQQAAARQIFTRLTATTIDSVDTAERASRAELTEGKDAAQERDVEAVLEAFASERLLTLAAGTVEISHEVLLTSWPLLRDTWLAETHADRIVRTRLHNAAAEWESRSRDPSYLYSGSLLETATATAARISADPIRYAPLSKTERDFVRASEHAQHRRMRRRRAAVAVLAALALIASTAAVWAFHERSTAQAATSAAIAQRNQAISAEVATAANQLYASNPALAGRLSLAAFQLAPSPEAYGSLLNATAKLLAGQLATIPDSDAEVFNADGSMLATSSTDGVQLWHVNAADPTDSTLVTTIRSARAIHSSPQLWFDPGNSTILAILYGRYISLEDIDHPYRFSAGNLTDNAKDLAFSHNGRMVAVGYANGNVQLWNVADPRNITAISHPFRAPRAPNITVARIAFSPDGSMLATVSGPIIIPGVPESTETVRLWSLADPAKPRLLPTALASTTTMLAFSPVGHILATGSADNSVQLWNVTNPSHPTRTGSPLSGHTGTVDEMTFSADGHTLATASWDDSVRLWNVTDPTHPTALAVMGREPSMVLFASVAISPDGQLLAATGVGLPAVVGKTWLWKINPRQAAADVCTVGGSPSPPITQAQWRLYFPGEAAYSPPCPGT